MTPSSQVEIFLTEDSSIQEKDLDLSQLSSSARNLLLLAGAEGSFSFGVKICQGEEMKELHSQYMGDDSETDVMSFDADESEKDQGYLGDVIACSSVAEKEANARGHGFLQELHFYILHGFLHLLGYDDATEADREHMLNLQKQAMEKEGESLRS
ncbi:MAG: rRNA maturation RNase YbeY [Planctomycetes bacterium]|nr:rRNA maturation RNase YbeY [Planctomycetota bacterium]